MAVLLLTIQNYFIEIKNSGELFLERLIRTVIYLAVFMLPFFYLPNSSLPPEFLRISLFYGLIFIGVFIWLLKIYLSKRINLGIKSLDVLVSLILVVYFIVSLFAVDQFNSLIGKNLVFTNSLATIFSLVVFYFMVSRFIKSNNQISLVFYLLVISFFVILCAQVAQLFISDVNLGFSLSFNGLIIILISAFFLDLFLILLSPKKKISKLLVIVAAFFIISSYVIDNQVGLLTIALSLFLLILLFSFQSAYFSNKSVLILTAILFLTVIILVLPMNQITGIISPQELTLPWQYNWQITKAGLADNLLLAVGPQNYLYSFYKYKPLALNSTNFWQLAFYKAPNFWLEILNTAGLIMIVLIFILGLKYCLAIFRYVRKMKIQTDSDYQDFVLICGLSVLLAAIVIWGFAANFDFIVIFLLFLFLALAVSKLPTGLPDKVFDNKVSLTFFCYLTVILVIISIYIFSRAVMADYQVRQALARPYNDAADFDKAEVIINQAMHINKNRQDYHLALANVLLAQEQFFIANGIEYNKLELENKIYQNLDLILNQDSQQIDLYLALQQTYDDMASYGYEVTKEKMTVINKLISLDPNNPEFYVDRALINFQQYNQIGQTSTDVAAKQPQIVYLINAIEADLTKSIDLKPDYVLGYFNLGLYWLEFGDEDQALAYMTKAYTLGPDQKIIVQSLKKLYLKQDKVDEAINILEKYLILDPQAEDVRLELADIYIAQKQADLAGEQLEIILQQSPDNEAAALKLKEVE